MRLWRVAGPVLGVCALLYTASAATFYWAMRQPPERFGFIMAHVPGMAMSLLPFEPMWISARAGSLQPGDMAPDFDLPTLDHARRVRISEEYRTKPVVLIFGSYT